jgi:flagellar assembly factor FliW
VAPRKRRPSTRRSLRGSARGTSFTVQRFGAAETIHVAPSDVIEFPDGLIGMESLRRFALLVDPRIEPCRWLQSLDRSDLSFVVVDPRVVAPDYALTAESLSGADELLVIMTIHADPERSTANLLAPVVVDRAARTGRQVIQHESGYDVRHPITHVTPEVGQDHDAGPSA